LLEATFLVALVSLLLLAVLALVVEDLFTEAAFDFDGFGLVVLALLMGAFFTDFAGDLAALFFDEAREAVLVLGLDFVSFLVCDLPLGVCVVFFVDLEAVDDLVLAGCLFLLTFLAGDLVVLLLEAVFEVAFFEVAGDFFAVDVLLEVAGLEVEDLLTVFVGLAFLVLAAALDFDDVVLFGAGFFAAGFEVADLLAGDLEGFLVGAFLGLEEALEARLLGGDFLTGVFFLEDTDGYSSESMATPSTIFGIGSEFADSLSL